MNEELSLRLVLRNVSLRMHVLGTASEDRPTLLFLHYFGGSGRSWFPVMQLLAPRGYCCLAPDLRGFGESAAGANRARSYSLKTWSNDVIELARFLELKSYVLIGHSMGGKIALAVAACAPAGLQSVILLAPSPPTSEPFPEEERTRLLNGYGDRAAARQTLRKITARPLSPGRAAVVLEDNLRTAPAAWEAWLQRGTREDISASLRNVRVPVSVAVGSADKTITHSLVQSEIVARMKTSVAVRVIQGSGHLIPMEKPSPTAEYIVDAVKAADRKMTNASRHGLGGTRTHNQRLKRALLYH